MTSQYDDGIIIIGAKYVVIQGAVSLKFRSSVLSIKYTSAGAI